MAAFSWRTWPDVLIDFGREAYVAWRLSEGAVLQRDVVSVSGPLSPYWNALAFRCFGASLDTLFAVNAALLAGLVVVWYRLLLRIADRTAACVGGAVLVLLFGFAQYVGVGNYNHIAPYSHEMTHGLLLASLGFLCWDRAARAPGRATAWWIAAGTALGCVALTKIELLAAAGLANALALGSCVRAERDAGIRRAAPRALGFAAGFAAPLLAAMLLLTPALGAAGAAAAVGVGWLRLFRDDLAALPFYRTGLGVDALGANIGLALAYALAIAALFGALALAARALERRLVGGRFGGLRLTLAFALATTAVLAPFWREMPWLPAARALPVFALAGLVATLVQLRRPGLAGGQALVPSSDAARAQLRAVLALFATALLAKIFFHARIHQYGFVLALPATLLFVAALVAGLPATLERRGGGGAAFRGAALAVLGVAVCALLAWMAPYFEVKSGRVGGVHDQIRVQPGVGKTLGAVLQQVHVRTRPSDSIAVLPEGVMLNFLARRPTPTRFFSFNPFELHVYGEDEILRAFQESPPDLVILLHQDMREHGARFLGRDYGVQLLAWIRAHYREVRRIGDPPLEPDSRYGVSVLERAADPG
jgi:hypothetical protein